MHVLLHSIMYRSLSLYVYGYLIYTPTLILEDVGM